MSEPTTVTAARPAIVRIGPRAPIETREPPMNRRLPQLECECSTRVALALFVVLQLLPLAAQAQTPTPAAPTAAEPLAVLPAGRFGASAGR